MLNRLKKSFGFSVIYNAIRKTSKLVSDWRFIFVLYLIIHLLLGQSPFMMINKYLRANNSDIKVINLYVNNSRTSFNANGRGWTDKEKAHSAPSVSALAKQEEFNNENSSKYSGDGEIIVLSDFWFLEEELINEELKINPSIELRTENEELEDDTASSSSETISDDEVVISEISTSSQEVSEEDVIEIASSSEESLAEFELASTSVDVATSSLVKIIKNISTTTVEIIEIMEASTTIMIETSTSSVEAELPYDFDNLIGIDDVQAQEFISSEINNLSELGTLTEAKIFLSLAIKQDKKQGEFILYEDLELGYPLASFDSAQDKSSEQVASSTENISTTTKTVEIEEIIKNSSTTIEIIKEEAIASSSVSKIWLNNFLNISDVNAQNQLLADANLALWYSLGEKDASSSDIVWQLFETITKDNFSNYINNAYLNFNAPFLSSFIDIENLEIKIEGRLPNGTDLAVYLDSVWVEATYDEETELDKIKKRERWENALELISDNLIFSANEQGEFAFKYNKNEERIWDTLKGVMGFENFWQDVAIDALLVDSSGKVVSVPLIMMFESDGNFSVRLSETRELKPGEYTLKFHIEDNSGDELEVFDLSQEFSWGILAMNFNKHEYAAGDEAYIQMAVLDSFGHTECGALLQLKIKNEKLKIGEVFSTETGSIKKSAECGPETVTDEPDYFVDYQFEEEGEYIFEMTAVTAEGERTISESVQVLDNQKISIERIGATRIYPKVDYEMTMLVSVEDNFKGDIIELVPSGFKVVNYELRIMNDDIVDPFGSNYRYAEDVSGDTKKLIWQDVEILAGDILEIKYIYDAPNESPKLFSAGPLNFGGFEEKRKWQIASDAINKRARTVMFVGGVYNGDGTTGQDTNIDNTFSSFHWRLAESGVDIRNAFVVFETQFESYDANGGDYTGYKLGFDACEETCTAVAFGTGNGQVLDNNSNILAYDENESNQVKLLLDVTGESQLAAYAGEGVEMESQIGYHIKNASSRNSIANARAILVVTYVYDSDSSDITNTVVYPLDSTSGTDLGTRQSSQGACTADTNCPTFSYEMDIPEWPGFATSTNRLAQWFKIYDHNDGNGSTNMDPYLDIEDYNVDSSSNHHECNNGSTQGNMPSFIWPDWTNSGYMENEAQELEYYVNSGTNYAIGGEVFETYIASSSATEKTRTVSFPIGIISNGNSTAQHSGETYVYFPENGTGTGTVDVKSAWLRIKTHNYNSAALDSQISTKVGSNATTSALTYDYNGGGSVIKPLIDLIHIIPSADYTAMEAANADTGVFTRVNVTNSAVSYDGVSAELMITYTYTDEANGYNTSLALFGGQSSEAPLIASTTRAANSVMPESGGKVVYAGGITGSFLNSDSAGSVGAGSVFLLDIDLSTTTPSCSGAYGHIKRNAFCNDHRD